MRAGTGIVTAAAAGFGGVRLSWNDNSTNEVRFRIERRTDDTAFTALAEASRVAGQGGAGAYLDGSVQPATRYTYRVRAENTSGASAWSNELTVTTQNLQPTVITGEPVPTVVRTGAAASFAVMATGEMLSYQWRRDGVDLPGQTSPILHLTAVGAAAAGVYSVIVYNPVQSIETAGARLTVAAAGTARLANLSARAAVAGDRQLVPGFVVGGTGRKTLLVRAVGPGLAKFGVGGVLPDPTLSFYSGPIVTASNDDWGVYADQAGLEQVRQRVQAFPLDPGSRDSALLVDVGAGSIPYTVLTTGAAGTSGVALVEVYDGGNSAGNAELLNLSVRAFTGSGEQVLNPGFVVAGDVAMTLLVRGVGPALAAFGVTGVLDRPKLTLYRQGASGAVAVATNEGWQANANRAAIEAAVQSTGAFPLPAAGADSALLLALPPGNYTARVEGVSGETGVALVELYVVP